MAVNLCFLDQSRYFFIQVAPQLTSRDWVDPVPDPLLLRKSGSAGNRTWDLCICSQKLWPQRRLWMNEWMNEWMKICMYVWMNEWIEVSQTPPLLSVPSHVKPFSTSHPISTQFYPSTYAYTFRVTSFLQVFPPYPCISFLSHAYHVPHPSHLPWLDLCNI